MGSHFLGGGNSKIFGIFTPKIGEDEPILIHIFQRGWFNHQLVFNVPDLLFLFVSRKAIMPRCLEDRRIVLDHQPFQSTLTH